MERRTAFVFPGQGAQAVGMGRDAFEQEQAARAVFEQADQALGYELSSLIFNGPEEELKQTYHTQPALLTVSVAYLTVLGQSGIRPDYVAGHSLGEYSALVAAGVLPFSDAVRLVRLRGEYMNEAVPAGQGTMAAVLGAERGRLQALCESVTREIAPVEMANVNCPGQFVVSGTTAGVTAVAEQAREKAGAKRVVPLEVSGPFHSSLMKPAAEKLENVLRQVHFSEPEIPVVANATAEPVSTAAELKRLLVDQVVSPVLWEDSVLKMMELGVTTFVEIGSGSVLSGLIKKTSREAEIYTINSMEALERFASQVK